MILKIYEVPEQIETRCGNLYGATHVIRYFGTECNAPWMADFSEGTVLYNLYDKLGRNNVYEYDLIPDISIAKSILKQLDCDVPEKQFRIVELTLNDSPPEVGRQLIGYDISILYDMSLIVIAFIAYDEKAIVDRNDSNESESLGRLEPLYELLMSYFCRKLNSNGLFNTYSDALFCLHCMRALNDIEPNLWESQDVMADFDVVGLYEV